MKNSPTWISADDYTECIRLAYLCGSEGQKTIDKEVIDSLITKLSISHITIVILIISLIALCFIIK